MPSELCAEEPADPVLDLVNLMGEKMVGSFDPVYGGCGRQAAH
jgi:hypothetical protein